MLDALIFVGVLVALIAGAVVCVVDDPRRPQIRQRERGNHEHGE